jgi:hypothetical protein
MRTYEMFGWLVAGLGAWALYDATLSRLRSVFDRVPRRGPQGYAGFWWRMERREAAARAARWQSVSVLLVVVGAVFALAVRLAA